MESYLDVILVGTWMLCGNGSGRYPGWHMDALREWMESEHMDALREWMESDLDVIMVGTYGCSAGMDGV